MAVLTKIVIAMVARRVDVHVAQCDVRAQRLLRPIDDDVAIVCGLVWKSGSQCGCALVNAAEAVATCVEFTSTLCVGTRQSVEQELQKKHHSNRDRRFGK